MQECWQPKQPERFNGVVTLSQIERKLPTTANTEARDFNDLVCCSIAKIRLISPNVTTPVGEWYGIQADRCAEKNLADYSTMTGSSKLPQ
jgi:hypothetical protein